MPSRLVAIALGSLCAAWLATPSLAGSRAEPVDGHSVRVTGITKQTSSFAPRTRESGWLALRFEDDRFSAAAIAGRFEQQGRKLRFEVDPEMLDAYEASWELLFAAELAAEDLEPEALACRITKSKVKGRVRDERLAFKSTFKIRCEATGDFGRVTGRGTVRFRGRGELGSEPAPLRPPFVGNAGLGWNLLMPLVSVAEDGADGTSPAMGGAGLILHIDSGWNGNAGAVIELVPATEQVPTLESLSGGAAGRASDSD